MELQYYETIRETGHLQVRFEPVLSPAGVFPAHWHEYVEILYIKNGVLSAIVQTVEYELHTGDLMIINSGDLHMTRTPGCHYLILQISARQLRSYLPDFDQLRFDTLIPYTKSRQNTQLFSALHAMETIFQEQPHHYELLFTVPPGREEELKQVWKLTKLTRIGVAEPGEHHYRFRCRSRH